MKCAIATLALSYSLFATTLLAEQGVPSQARLNQLGLGSMQMATDQHGAQVRGRFYFSYSFVIQARGDTTVSMRSGGDTFGTPLSYDPPPVALPIIVNESEGPIVDTMGTTTDTGQTSFTLNVGDAVPFPMIAVPTFNAQFSGFTPLFNLP